MRPSPSSTLSRRAVSTPEWPSSSHEGRSTETLQRAALPARPGRSLPENRSFRHVSTSHDVSKELGPVGYCGYLGTSQGVGDAGPGHASESGAVEIAAVRPRRLLRPFPGCASVSAPTRKITTQARWRGRRRAVAGCPVPARGPISPRCASTTMSAQSVQSMMRETASQGQHAGESNPFWVYASVTSVFITGGWRSALQRR